MADYQDIRGLRVKYLSADPSNTATGEVWYNSTTGTLKTHLISEAWSSGAAMIRTTTTGGGNHALGTGTQTAGLYAGGYSPYTNFTEEFNGSGWTSGGNMNLTRITAGFGTQTAAVASGGISFPGTVGGQVEEYDGSTWTTATALGTARAYVAGSGVLTAGLVFGGSETANPTSVGNTEEYNGASWAEQTDLTNGRRLLGTGGRGPQTASLGFGGNSAPTAYWTATEAYNGTSWANQNSMNTGRYNLGSAGDQTAALAFGGTTGSDSAATESWDGTNWSTSPATLANARTTQPSIGTSTVALFVGGPNPHYAAGWVEEYNRSGDVITGATWAALPALGTARYGVGMGYVDNANALGGMCVGSAPYRSGLTENYDGSSWTASGAMGTARYRVSGGGTQISGIAYGGFIPPASYQTACEEYDGSSWTGGTALPTAAQFGAGNGPQTAAMYTGINEGPGDVNTTRLYDGGTWTTGGTLTSTRRNGTLIGNAATQTAALYVGGYPNTTNAESYNGSTWTASPAITVASHAIGNAGVQADALIFGGADFTAGSARWDDTAWVSDANLTSGRAVGAGGGGGGAATASNAMAIGGNPVTTNVEQYSGSTSAVNIKTLTTS